MKLPSQGRSVDFDKLGSALKEPFRASQSIIKKPRFESSMKSIGEEETNLLLSVDNFD